MKQRDPGAGSGPGHGKDTATDLGNCKRIQVVIVSIHVTRSSMPSFEEYVEEIRELWDSHHLTNMGVKHETLVAHLKEYLNVQQLTLFSNGHLALEAILGALDLRGEVITTPFTFPSTTHAIVRMGLTPVFVDIDPETLTLDPGKIEALITEKTSAILPVHVYGRVCDVKGIGAIAREHGLKVIYDAAHAFGVTYEGQGIGTWGDAAMFSFHATKVFQTIEGGAVAYRDAGLGPVLDGLKNFGITGPEAVDYVGGNAKMNEFQAAMGLCNLKYVDAEMARRAAVVQRYDDWLLSRPGIRQPLNREGASSNHAYYPVIFEGSHRSRDEVFDRLRAHDIYPRKYFYPLTSLLSCYEGQFDGAATPVAREISERVLTLPLYADLDLSEVDRICELILR